MAYGEKYRFCAESQNGSEIKVLILQDGYTGQVYDRPMGRSPLLRRENSGMIMGSSFELYAECLVDAEYAELYTSSAREFKVEVYKDETVIWFGFITPELYSEPDIAPPYDVQIVATDGLGELKNYEFLSSGPESLYSHLVNLLQYTGLNLDFLIASTLQYIDGEGAESGQNSLLNFQIDLSHLEGENCYDVLQILLSSLNARIMMYDGQWLVYRETDLVHLASGIGLRVYDSGGLYKTLDVASFGSMTSCQWWPVGQLSSVIVPAKNRLSIQSPNHYKNNILDDSAWTVENSASYDSEEGAYILPDEGSNIVQKIEFERELGSRLRLSILARNVGSGEEDQPIGIEVLIDGRSYAGARQYWLVQTAESDRGIGAYVWKTTEGQIEGELAIPSDSDTSDDAQEIEIILPLYANDSRSYFYASSVQVRLFNPAGTHDIYVYDCRLSLYNQKQGWKTDALIDNQAREDAGTTDVTMIDSSTALSTADIIMTGVPLDPQGRIIQNWKIGEDSEGSYLTVLTEDYAMGVALPRMKYTGTLNVPAGHIPSLFLRDGRFYSLMSYIYDMLNDEVEVELLSVPVADIEVSQEILPIASATGATSSGSSGGSGGGIGSGGGPSIWDWFYLTEDGKSIGTKYNFFSELEISANGLHVGGGSGGGTGGSSTLAGLTDVTLSSPVSGNILVYNGTHWVNKPQSELVPDIDLSDYYTKTDVDTKLGAYVKTTDADTKYAPLSGFNTLKSDFDALNAALNDDVSGKINTWNEIVDFVDEYSGSEDLATIISGLSTQVNGKVAISTYNDFLATEYNPLKTKVGAMEAAITTNTAAIQAVDLKVTNLGNHMTGVDETIVAIQTQTDGINKRLVAVETWKETTDTTVQNLSTQVSTNKTNIEKILGWFKLDSSGNLYTEKNFYSTKEISANGLGQGTGGSGGSGLIKSVLGVSALGTALTEDNKAVFNAFATNKVYNDLVTLTDRVDNLTTVTSAVGWSGEITSGKKIGTLTINGLENYLYAPATYAFSEITGKPTNLEGYGITDKVVKYWNGVFTPAESELSAQDVFEALGKGTTLGRSGWSYAENGYLTTPFGAIDLAGVSVIQWKRPWATDKEYTQLYITSPTHSTANAITGEMLYYVNNGDVYSPTWYRVLTNKNYTDYTYSKSTVDAKLAGYLPLSGGTINGASALDVHRNDGAYGSLIKFSNTNGELGYIGFAHNKTATIWANQNEDGYPILHSGNIGDYSIKRVHTGSLSDANNASYTDKCLRWFSEIPNDSANLPTFAGRQNGLLALPLHTNGATAQLYFHRSDGLFYRGHIDNDWKEIIHSGNAGRHAMLAGIGIHSSPTSHIVNSGLTYWENGVAAGYRGQYGTSLWVQFNAKNTSGSRWRNRLDFATTGQISLWQGVNTETMSYVGELAYMHSNVASATKLATARTIWGQSFDGTGNVSGHIYGGQKLFSIYGYDDNGNTNIIDCLGTNKQLWIGYGSAAKSYNTELAGYNINFHYGTGRTTGLVLNSSGNVGIGTTDPQYKLHVNGKGRFSGAVTISNTLNISSSVGKGQAVTITDSSALSSHGRAFTALYPNAVKGAHIDIYAGVANSAKNGGYLGFYYDAAASDNNRISLGLYAKDNVLNINGKGHVLINTTVDSGNELEVNGKAYANNIYGGNSIYAKNYLFMNYDNSGIYLSTSSISWHSGNSYKSSLLEFTQTSVKISQALSAGATTLSSLTVNGGAVITSSAKINEVTYGYGTITFDGNIQINPTVSGARVYLNTSTYGLTCTGGALSVGYIGEKSGYKFYVRSGNAYVEGNIAADGEISANVLNTGSDIRFKNKISDVVLDLDTMANAPMFRFTWNNRKDDRVYIGSSAQYWKRTSARELVSKGCDDFHRLDYATLGVMMGISIARKTKNHEDRIKELEMKVESLELENRRLRYGN